jgi:hypothetical protein
MTLSGPTHTWTMSRNSKLIRFYKWFYLADDFFWGIGGYTEEKVNKGLAKLNFCRLAWSVIAAPFIVLLCLAFAVPAAIIFGLYTLCVGIGEGMQDHKTRKTAAQLVANLNREAIPEATAKFFDRIVAFFQRHSLIGKVFGAIATSLLWVFILGIPAAILSGSGYEIANHPKGFLTGLEWAGVSVGGIAIVFVLSLGFWALFVKTSLGSLCLDAMGWGFDAVIDFVCWIGRGFRYLGRFVTTLDHAVKYRTCPLIKITDD